MKTRHSLVLFAATAVLVASSGRAVVGQAPGTPVATATDARAVLDQYCVRCHNDRRLSGDVSLEGVDLEQVGTHAETLERAVRKLRAGVMPPRGNPRPEPATYAALTGWLETALDEAAAGRPNPGRTEALHRLNRAEYANVIRDLLALDGLNYATVLPGDDASYGFDNIAGVLGMTSTHLERYMTAARTISRLAVGDVTLPPDGETYLLPPDLTQDYRLTELPFGTRGGTLIRRYFPVDADYVIRFQAFTGIGESEAEPNFIEVSIDGERIFYEQMRQKPIKHTITGADIQANTDWELRVPVEAGLRDVAVTFVQTTFGQAEDYLQPFLRPPGISSFRLTRMGGNAGPYVGQVLFAGPFDATGPGDTPSRQRIFSCRPAEAAAEEACAREILSALARRAYRRPVDDADVNARSTGPSEKPRMGGRIPRINDPLGLRAHRDPTWAVNMDGWEMTPINWASRQGHLDAVEALLAAGADVNDPKSDGRTNLILAIENRHYELAGYLLDQGADPNLGSGYTALHQIAWTRRLNAKFGPLNPEATGTLDSFDLAKQILAHGVDVDARMENSFQDGYRNRMIRIGATAFLLSSKLVDLPMMKLLVEHGADIHIQNLDNDTPLILATGGSTLNPNEDAGTEEEALTVVQYLVEELGFDVNAVNNNGETPMFGPSYRGWNRVARYLADQGAEVDAENVLEWTPTSLADGVFFAGFFKAQPQTAALLRQIYVERGLTPPDPPKLNDTSLLTVGSVFARGDIVVEPTQGNYQRVESLEGAEFPLLVVTGVDAQGQPSGTEPYNPDGR